MTETDVIVADASFAGLRALRSLRAMKLEVKVLEAAAPSYYMGAEIAGKPKVFMPCSPVVRGYRHILEKCAAQGFAGFARHRTAQDCAGFAQHRTAQDCAGFAQHRTAQYCAGFAQHRTALPHQPVVG